MSEKKFVTVDANEAVAYVAYRINEVCAIYPITPSSAMAELADLWSSEGKTNLWGQIPLVVEMQSEGGAAGAVHGALQTGALTTTFTASQGLLLMIPNMYKIAGELTPAVFHVAARSLATQGLSIFGDHSDVTATRATGFAQLCSASVQEAHDLALVAQACTLQSRVPFLHFFDGFRTSHEENKISLLSDQILRTMINQDQVLAHRARGLSPENPFIRGTAQNPDVYFQSRETVNSFYAAVPKIVQEQLDQLGSLTGRYYKIFDYFGDPCAERVIVVMGSASYTVRQTVCALQAMNEKVGVVQVRLPLPFSFEHFTRVLPDTVKSIAVLDRTKVPGSLGEPLYMDVLAALYAASRAVHCVVGGRYGLSSKEFNPAMVKGIFEELKKETPKNGFTVGIEDDIGRTHLNYDPHYSIEPENVVRAIFFGLGSDGTVGANKNTVKIIGESTHLFVQGYYVYDSKKSGSHTISHLRFGPEPIQSPYLIDSANFVACHQFGFLEKTDVLDSATDGATFLLDSPYPAEKVWDHLTFEVQEQLIQKRLRFYVINAAEVARLTGMGNRTNTVMQVCFFALSSVLPQDVAIQKIKEATRKTYGKKGEDVVQKNFQAIDQTLARLSQVKVPDHPTSQRRRPPTVAPSAPGFVKDVTAVMMAGRGDSLPVSALPNDGTYPSGTAKWEKRSIASFIPDWDEHICIQCGNCSFVCPHSVIRSKFFHQEKLIGAPKAFKSSSLNARGFPESRYSLAIYPEDCTGCGLCVEVCPVTNPKQTDLKAINMKPKDSILEREQDNLKFFETIPYSNRSKVDFSSVRGVQFLEPLFEFSGACAGCGETPYVKVLSQLFGDRLVIANATGCSSIYGGNLPTTPWTKNEEGKGPAWSNSLFEDNAEFGLGFRLSADQHLKLAQSLLCDLKLELDSILVEEILSAPLQTESEIRLQRERVSKLKTYLFKLGTQKAKDLLSVVDHFIRRSVWLVGGDGWAYDIGSGGLDHVLATGKNVNVLVLDTEVYSNTGGQMSKSTPLGAVAKFAAGGKPIAKKDLALQAIAYGNVYVARVAMGANPQQTILAFREAEAYRGPSLILAYSHCIAHGIDMQKGLKQQEAAVSSGYWPLIRYNPVLRGSDKNPFVLDSLGPRIKFHEYADQELRYRALKKTNPEYYEKLMEMAQIVVDQKWKAYREMAMSGAGQFHPDAHMT